MTALPAPLFFTTTAPSNLQAKQALDDMNSFARARPGGDAISTKVLAIDSLTPTTGIHAVDSEAGGATDNLKNIATTNHTDGSLLLLTAANAAHVITAVHLAGGAGQLHLDGAANYTMSTTRYIMLMRIGADWFEVRLR